MVTTGVAHQLVALDGHALAARHAEGGNLRVAPPAPGGLLEELQILRVAARPAALDVVNPEGVNPLGDAELVRDREVDAFALRAVAQGRVIEFDCRFHKARRNGNALSTASQPCWQTAKGPDIARRGNGAPFQAAQ
jgi:hypothetical protein